MPTYAYKCNDCDAKFDVFQKTVNQVTEVKCPTCSSENSKKLMSATNFSGFSSTKSFDMPSAPSCASGMCGFNNN